MCSPDREAAYALCLYSATLCISACLTPQRLRGEGFAGEKSLKPHARLLERALGAPDETRTAGYKPIPLA